MLQLIGRAAFRPCLPEVVWCACENASTANEVNIFFGLLQSFCLLFAQLLGSKQTLRLSTVAASDDIADVGCCHRRTFCVSVSAVVDSRSFWRCCCRGGRSFSVVHSPHDSEKDLKRSVPDFFIGSGKWYSCSKTMLLLACTIMFGRDLDRTSLLNSSGRFFFF